VAGDVPLVEPSGDIDRLLERTAGGGGDAGAPGFDPAGELGLGDRLGQGAPAQVCVTDEEDFHYPSEL